MKRVLICFSVCYYFSTLAVHADVIWWKGISWDTWSLSAAVDGSTGYLALTSTLTRTPPLPPASFGLAYYDPPEFFRNATNPWVEVGFLDNPSTSNCASVGFLDLTTSAYVEVGDWTRRPTPASDYRILSESENALPTLSLGQRTSGENRIKVGRRSDGSIDFYLNGVLERNLDFGNLDSFGEIYLFVNGYLPYQTVIYTDFQVGTNYAPVPEPGSLILLGTGLGALGLGAWRRRT